MATKAKTRAGAKGAAAKAKAGATVPAKQGEGAKQTQALYQRSLATRKGGESAIGPEADENAQSGAEQTSAADPRTKQRELDERNAARRAGGRAASAASGGKPASKVNAMQDEVVVDQSPAARESRLQKLQGVSKKVTAEQLGAQLPVGSVIEIGADEVRIRYAVGGGASRYAHGPTLSDALAMMQQEAEEGPARLDHAPKVASTPQIPQGETDETPQRKATRGVTPKGGKASSKGKAGARKGAKK